MSSSEEESEEFLIELDDMARVSGKMVTGDLYRAISDQLRIIISFIRKLDQNEQQCMTC